MGDTALREAREWLTDLAEAKRWWLPTEARGYAATLLAALDAPAAVPVPEGEPSAPEKNDSGAPDGDAPLFALLDAACLDALETPLAEVLKWPRGDQTSDLYQDIYAAACALARPEGAYVAASEADQREALAAALAPFVRAARNMRDELPALDWVQLHVHVRDVLNARAVAASVLEQAPPQDDARAALAWYAERRNYRNGSGDKDCVTVGEGLCALHARDSYDGEGPGARARSALAPIVAPLGEGEQSADRTIEPSESAPDGGVAS